MTPLILKRRFFPLFVTQFLGAFNDNVFKNSVALLVAFTAASQEESGLLINLAAGLFILPFALFSPIAGKIGDKYDKSRVLQLTKLFEVAVMCLAAAGFYFNLIHLLMATIFLMGTQSAFFGPAKYSILPEHLKEEELTSGNGIISMFTFIAIILGVILSSLLVKEEYRYLLPLVVVILSGLGFVSSLKIPKANTGAKNLKIGWNIFADVSSMVRATKKYRSVFLSVMAISWLWGIGSVILTQLPNVAKYVLYGNEDMAVALTICFVFGISVGSLLCVLLSRREIELGLVPIGAFGMTVFGVAFSLWENPDPVAGQTIKGFLSVGWENWKLFIYLAMVGVSASVYMIPLNALVQSRSDEEVRSRVIATLNIFNALFMVSASVICIVLFKIEFDTMSILLWFFVVNLVISVYIFFVVPEFFMRFVVWILANTIYDIRYEGRENIPKRGAAIIVANHVSFIDWFILTATCKRPIHFIMYHKIFNIPGLNLMFKLSKAIPIAPAKEDAKVKEAAFVRSKEVLVSDKLLCIFPEGMITHDGLLNPFKPGIEQIKREHPSPVVPIALVGLWGSFFSRQGGAAMKGLPKPRRRRIVVRVGELLPPEAKASDMEAEIQKLLDRDSQEVS